MSDKISLRVFPSVMKVRKCIRCEEKQKIKSFPIAKYDGGVFYRYEICNDCVHEEKIEIQFCGKCKNHMYPNYFVNDTGKKYKTCHFCRNKIKEDKEASRKAKSDYYIGLLKKHALVNNGTCNSTECHGTKYKVDYSCNIEGHADFKGTIDSMRAGDWCPACKKEENAVNKKKYNHTYVNTVEEEEKDIPDEDEDILFVSRKNKYECGCCGATRASSQFPKHSRHNGIFKRLKFCLECCKEKWPCEVKYCKGCRSHVMEKKYGDLKKCTFCSNKSARLSPERNRLNRLNQIAKEANCTLVSKKCPSDEDMMDFKCSDNHLFSKQCAYVLAKKNLDCPVCRDEKKKKKKDMEKALTGEKTQNELFVEEALQTCENLANKNDGKYVSKFYKNKNTKHKFECKNNHKFELTWVSVKKSNWCPKCKGVIKWNLERCKELAASMGLSFDSPEYTNIKIKYKWSCLVNPEHKWEARVDEMKRRKNKCNMCDGLKKRMSRTHAHLLLDNCIEYAKKKKGECLSKCCKKFDSEITYKCSNNHVFTLPYSGIYTNTWCKKCSGKEQHTTQECHDLAESRGYRFMDDEYINAHHKHNWLCIKDGHAWRARYKDIASGRGCAACAGNKKITIEYCKEFAKSRGFRCVSDEYINNDTELEWVCAKGHKFSSKWRFLNKTNWCSECSACPDCFGNMKGDTVCKDCNGIKKRGAKETGAIRYLNKNITHHKILLKKAVKPKFTKNDIQGYGRYYPDISYDCGKYRVIIEVDEFHHRGAGYACDVQRMYNIVCNLQKCCVFIRYNPDGKGARLPKLLKKVVEYLDAGFDGIKWHDTYGLIAEYMFYPEEKKINIPKIGYYYHYMYIFIITIIFL